MSRQALFGGALIPFGPDYSGEHLGMRIGGARVPYGFDQGMRIGGSKNPWIAHVKQFAASNGVSYGDALKYHSAALKATYSYPNGHPSGGKKRVARVPAGSGPLGPRYCFNRQCYGGFVYG